MAIDNINYDKDLSIGMIQCLMQSTASWISFHYVCIKGQRQGLPISFKVWGITPVESLLGDKF